MNKGVLFIVFFLLESCTVKTDAAEKHLGSDEGIRIRDVISYYVNNKERQYLIENVNFHADDCEASVFDSYKFHKIGAKISCSRSDSSTLNLKIQSESRFFQTIYLYIDKFDSNSYLGMANTEVLSDWDVLNDAGIPGVFAFLSESKTSRTFFFGSSSTDWGNMIQCDDPYHCRRNAIIELDSLLLPKRSCIVDYYGNVLRYSERFYAEDSTVWNVLLFPLPSIPPISDQTELADVIYIFDILEQFSYTERDTCKTDFIDSNKPEWLEGGFLPYDCK